MHFKCANNLDDESSPCLYGFPHDDAATFLIGVNFLFGVDAVEFVILSSSLSQKFLGISAVNNTT